MSLLGEMSPGAWLESGSPDRLCRSVRPCARASELITCFSRRLSRALAAPSAQAAEAARMISMPVRITPKDQTAQGAKSDHENNTLGTASPRKELAQLVPAVVHFGFPVLICRRR